MTNYFPTKVAKGAAFCNRTEEIERLKNNIEMVNPTLIISPRRYGKTSLCLNVFEQIKTTYVVIDLYKAFSEEDIERLILNGIGALLGKLEKTHKKLIALASEFFSSLHVNVSIANDGLQLDFTKRKRKPSENIFKALEKLHDVAKRHKQKVILYLDEFQSVGEVCKDHTLEAALREIAQNSEYIIFIFSGSDRHLIEQIFNDKKKPFYNLCDTIILDRISEDAYKKHLNKASAIKWGKDLLATVVEQIFEYTECHSYYFNKLCSLLWFGNYPTTKMVEETWFNFVAENKSAVERELSLLTVNQRKILIKVAQLGGVKEFYSQEFLAEVGLSNSSTAKAVKFLLEKDYIYYKTSASQYMILDPLIKSVLDY